VIEILRERQSVTQKHQPSNGLSAREREVLVLVASGKSSRQIAEQLGIAFKTVIVHRHNLHTKLKLHKAVDLARVAIRMGLIKA
jgi:DNA-binding NarL/FixJ family response regulator